MYRYPISVQVYKGWGVPSGSRYLQPIYDQFDFIVRSVSRKDYKAWHAECPSLVDFEGKLLRECVVSGPDTFRGSPWDWDECFAGVAEQVLEKIYRVSGFGSAPDPELVSSVEEYLNGPEARFDLVIMTAYNYKLAELMEMDHRDWHLLVGLAQMKLEMMEIDTEAILYPERAKKRKGGLAIPKGAQMMAQGGVPVDPTAMGGARPFFGNSSLQGRNDNSPYPAGHPRNPAVMSDQSLKLVPGAEGPVTFTSG